MRGRNAGFTLLEVMIVVAIIGILASIAYPSYTRYVERSIRTDAYAGLANAASELERCYTRGYSYVECNITTNSPENEYSISYETNSDVGYVISAEQKNSRSDGCTQPLTLNGQGLREPEECWN